MKIARREFITLLGGTTLAWPLAARAQQPGKIWRIGVLETISAASNAANFEPLRQGLRELGYVEGKNLVFDYRAAEGRNDRFPELAADLVRLKSDVIITRGTPSALAAKNATQTIPVVMAAIGDPASVADSIARPGGNITGLSSLVADLYPKRVELLRDLMPAVSRIAALFNMSNPITAQEWNEVQAAARSLGIAPEVLDIRERNGLAAAFAGASGHGVEALIIGMDTLTQTNREFVAKLAAQQRMPAIFAAREFVDAGGLIGLGVSYPDLYRRAAAYVDKIFKGAKPGDLPIEQPTKFELVINLKAAKALGLTVPPLLLARADEVIE